MSTREICKEKILLKLSEGEKHFEELANEIDHSRGTIDKSLDELCSEGLVKQKGLRGHRPYVLTEEGKVMVGKLILFKENVNKGLEAKSPQEVKAVLVELKRIIEAALQVPDEELNAWFSCMAQFENAITGVYEMPNNK